MRQIVQQLDTGATLIVDAPAPAVRRGAVLIQSKVSLISPGTERMLVNFGKASMIQKARQQPERVKAVLEKVRTDGLLTTIDAVRSKLGQPIPLGYSNAGTVIAVGAGVTDLSVGDRVVSNGPHADLVHVPRNLCARIPNGVSDDEAVFTVIASIGLQGIRLAQPTLGETFVVSGVGLIGLLTAQLLRAQGCRVLALDFDPAKLQLARDAGAETFLLSDGADPVSAAMDFSRGRGVDGVLIAASTQSNDPVRDAARMCRKRGRIVLIGVTGLELNRADFYEKELSFQVSCSYGPGRYDSAYEQDGHDYPVGFVRWTEQRNFEAVLDMLADRKLDVAPLISGRFRFDDASEAYAAVTGERPGLGYLLDYDPGSERQQARIVPLKAPSGYSGGGTSVTFVGAGNYASRMLMPAFAKAGAHMHTVATAGGLSAALSGDKQDFAFASTDTKAAIADPGSDAVVIATRHDSHAALAAEALAHGKHVFVEKPLGLTTEQVDEVEQAFREAHRDRSGPQLMIGFNRRFSPLTRRMKQLLSGVSEPKAFLLVMNAGAISSDHWTQDNAVGGGRIIGEACHHIDLMRHLAGTAIVSVQARRMEGSAGLTWEDKASITLGFADGSMGTIMYLANGGSSFPKERIEAFAAGRTLQLDNFMRLYGYNWPGFRKMSLMRQDKGQNDCAAAFIEAVRTGTPAIDPLEIFEVSRATIEAARQLRSQ